MKKEIQPITHLINACQLLATSLDLSEILQNVTKMTKDVLQAEAGSLFLLDEGTKTLRAVTSLGKKGSKIRRNFTLKVGQGIAGWVAKTGKPEFVKNVSKDKRFFSSVDKTTGFSTRSILAVPLKIHGKITGVLELINPRGATDFNKEDISLFQAFASQIAVAIENSRIHKNILSQHLIEQELGVACEIQKYLLPQKWLSSKNISVKAEYRPAEKIGGDFFDIIDFDTNRILITIGDVSGKGIPAALCMVCTLTELRSLARKENNITKIVNALNQQISKRTPLGIFTTAIFIDIDRKAETISIVNAGHPNPIMVQDSSLTLLETRKNIPLGIYKDQHYDSLTLAFNKNLTFLLYTDGITEARNKKKVEFGIDNLLKYSRKLNKKGNDKFLQSLFKKVDSFSKGTPQHDDLTAVLIELRK